MDMKTPFASDHSFILALRTCIEVATSCTLSGGQRPHGRIPTWLLTLFVSGVAIVFAGQLSAQAPGSLDPTFDGDGKVLTDIVNGGADRPSDVAVQSDGKIVVVGSSFAATSAFTLVRYETNGALDSNFGAGGKVTTSFGSGFAHAEAVAIQSDQKIVVVGRYLDGAASGFVIARYTTTGALDTNFNTTGYVMPDLGAGDEGAYDVAIQSADQKIVVVGGRWSGPPDGGMVAVRLTTTGALDPNFNGTGVKTVEMPVSWNAEVRVGINPVSGAITLGGHIQNEPFTWDAAVARLTATGTLDTTFNTTGTMSFPVG